MIPFQRPEPVGDAAVRERIARNRDLLAAARDEGDTAACLRLLGQIGNDERSRGTLAEAERDLTEAVALARACGDTQDLTANLIRLAAVRQYMERHAEAEPMFREALAHAQTREAGDYEDFALQYLGKCLVEMGRIDAAIECLDRALVLRWMKADPDLIASTEQALHAAHALHHAN